MGHLEKKIFFFPPPPFSYGSDHSRPIFCMSSKQPLFSPVYSLLSNKQKSTSLSSIFFLLGTLFTRGLCVSSQLFSLLFADVRGNNSSFNFSHLFIFFSLFFFIIHAGVHPRCTQSCTKSTLATRGIFFFFLCFRSNFIVCCSPNECGPFIIRLQKKSIVEHTLGYTNTTKFSNFQKKKKTKHSEDCLRDSDTETKLTIKNKTKQNSSLSSDFLLQCVKSVVLVFDFNI